MIVAVPFDLAMLIGGMLIFGAGLAFGFLLSRAMK